jgi:hypothetical protein
MVLTSLSAYLASVKDENSVGFYTKGSFGLRLAMKFGLSSRGVSKWRREEAKSIRIILVGVRPQRSNVVAPSGRVITFGVAPTQNPLLK